MDQQARVSQATGMVSVQAACTVEEALHLMEERAQIEHLTLWALAVAVIQHKIRFD